MLMTVAVDGPGTEAAAASTGELANNVYTPQTLWINEHHLLADLPEPPLDVTDGTGDDRISVDFEDAEHHYIHSFEKQIIAHPVD